MSAPMHKAGTEAPFLTGVIKVFSDKKTGTFTIEGPYSILDTASDLAITRLLPTGYSISEKTVQSGDKGMGKIVVKTNYYDDPASQTQTPIRTTFLIDVEEVVYDLIDHAALDGGPHWICEKWLATDESKRVKNGKYYYTDGVTETEITGTSAKRFCAAYLAGIKTFNQYFPVILKISHWTNPPGLLMSGGSFTEGSPIFSEGIGTYDDPPITLNGYGSGHWFKSKDSWQELANRTWTRTEQWTYTPEDKTGPHSWIYGGTPAAEDGGSGNGNGGNAS